MRTYPLSPGHHIGVFESIHELPVLRHAEFQVYTLYEAIGGDQAAVQRHLHQLHQFLASGRLDDASGQAAHLQYCHDFVFDRFHPQSLALACLVATVDGEPVSDLSETGLRALVARLDALGLTMGHVQDIVAEVKKKSRPS